MTRQGRRDLNKPISPRVARCRVCGSRLRGVVLERGGEKFVVAFVVCDNCERAAVAPQLVIEYLEEESARVHQA